MLKYLIWNNKGGTGKTTISFQVACEYARLHPKKNVLVVDVCPQANLSEIMLGGLVNNGADRLLSRHGMVPRCSIGGYFDSRISSPFTTPEIKASDYVTKPSHFNAAIPTNIDLICGDPLLELQAIGMNALANMNLPGVNSWQAVVDWLKDFLDDVALDYDTVFIDTNPSFSMYTQIALSASDKIVLPVMADDSSRRAIQNAFSLIYGVKLPSPIYSKYTFATNLRAAERAFPKIHLIVKNRLTQYMGAASAYSAVLNGIDNDLKVLIASYPDSFTFSKVSDGMVNVRDFGTTGVVAFARGCPFFTIGGGKLDIGGHRVQVNDAYLTQAKDAIKDVVSKL